jgi:uncharacterized iron-regulated protein
MFLFRIPFRAACLSALLLLALLDACGGLRADPVAPSAHPLEGKIWDVAAQRFITRETLLQRAAQSRFLLAGEVHDNPQHHAIQREILEHASTGGRTPALAMEQFDVQHQAGIDQALVGADGSPSRVADAGHFDRKGWNWPIYEPLIAIALSKHLPIVALNLSRPDAQKVSAQGFVALGTGRVEKLALEKTWNAERERKMEDEIAEGHCNQLPAEVLPKLVLAQRARDATMADALIEHAPDGAVAILGNGHAAADMGVPIYLAQRAPAAKVFSLGLIEVENGQETPADYLPKDGGRRFDAVWFTRPAERDDPCKDFKPPPAKR